MKPVKKTRISNEGCEVVWPTSLRVDSDETTVTAMSREFSHITESVRAAMLEDGKTSLEH